MAQRGYSATDDRSLSELFADASDRLQHLLRREIELAKIELQDQIDRGLKGVVLLAGTAVAGFLALVLLSLAAAWGLAEVMPVGFAFLVVGLVYLVVAAVLGAQGRKRLAELRPVPQQTVQTIKQDIQVAKDSISAGVSGDDQTSTAHPWRPEGRSDLTSTRS